MDILVGESIDAGDAGQFFLEELGLPALLISPRSCAAPYSSARRCLTKCQ